MTNFESIQSGWLEKVARDEYLWRKRFVILTPHCLEYFHGEPSDDLAFVKGTQTPLLRRSIELSRIRNVELIGEKQHKFKVFVEEADIKGKHDPSGIVAEYTFRCAGDRDQCIRWRDNILKARDAYTAHFATGKAPVAPDATLASKAAAADGDAADPSAVVQAMWMEKLAKDSLFQDYRKRYVMLTHSFLNYFHDEPSADLMFIKGTETPLLRRAIELNRIKGAEIFGVSKHKIRIFVEPADVKNHHSDSPGLEYVFRVSGDAEKVALFKSNLLTASDLYKAKLDRMTHFHGQLPSSSSAAATAAAKDAQALIQHPDEIVQQGWLQKLARDSVFQDYRKRYMVLTHQHLLYFHDEPSDDLMFIRGTDSPLLRSTFSLDRIRDVEIIGKQQHKLKVYIENPTVKNHPDANPIVAEYTFRVKDDQEECIRWRDNILRMRDTYKEKLEKATHFYGK